MEQASHEGSEPRVPATSGQSGLPAGSAAHCPEGLLPPTPPKAAKRTWGEGPSTHTLPQRRPKPLKTSRACPGSGWSQHGTGKLASGCRRAAFREEPLCQHPMTQEEQPPPPKEATDGAHLHVLSPAPWWWEGAGKHSSAACTTSLNQHQTSAKAPAATVTSQRSQFGTLLHAMVLNSQLSGVSHTSSLPGPEQKARRQDQLRQS